MYLDFGRESRYNKGGDEEAPAFSRAETLNFLKFMEVLG